MADNDNHTGPSHPADVSYETAKADIENALSLGIDAESDDPNLGPVVTGLTDPQIQWVAAWLASEGFTHTSTPPA